jgi:hypothetical protein
MYNEQYLTYNLMEAAASFASMDHTHRVIEAAEAATLAGAA